MLPMQLGTAAELDVFKYSIIAGCAMGIIYDLFSVIRKTIDKKAVTVVCDLLYTLMFSTAFFTVSLYRTHYLRGFVLVGMTVGAVMWSLTIGRLFVWIFVGILKSISHHLIAPVIVGICNFCKHISLKFVKNDINLNLRKKIAQKT